MDAVQNFLGAKSRKELKPILIAHLNIIMYAFCYWLCQPVLPFLMKNLGADMMVFGMLQTSFSILQFIGGPLMGSSADVYGPKFVLGVSVLAAAVSYGLLSVASTIPLVFLSQVPSIFQHAMMGAQAAIAGSSTSENAAGALGKLSLSYGIGMISGSSLGGVISKRTSHSTVAALASVLSLTVVIITHLTLEAAAPKAKSQKEGESSGGLNFKRIIDILRKNKLLRTQLIVVFLVSVALSMQRSTLQMLATTDFRMDEQDLGFVISFAGGLSVLTNAFVVDFMKRFLSDLDLMKVAGSLLAFCFVLYVNVDSTQALLIILVPMTVASSSLYTVSTAYLSNVSGDEHKGAGIGLSHGFRTLSGIIAPTLGGALLQRGIASLSYSCATFASAGVLLLVLTAPAKAAADKE